MIDLVEMYQEVNNEMFCFSLFDVIYEFYFEHLTSLYSVYQKRISTLQSFISIRIGTFHIHRYKEN